MERSILIPVTGQHFSMVAANPLNLICPACIQSIPFSLNSVPAAGHSIKEGPIMA